VIVGGDPEDRHNGPASTAFERARDQDRAERLPEDEEGASAEARLLAGDDRGRFRLAEASGVLRRPLGPSLLLLSDQGLGDGLAWSGLTCRRVGRRFDRGEIEAAVSPEKLRGAPLTGEVVAEERAERLLERPEVDGRTGAPGHGAAIIVGHLRGGYACEKAVVPHFYRCNSFNRRNL
jgi:hypothetical protein